MQRLLEIRGQARDKAAVYLADCRRQLARAESELNDRRQAVENCRGAQIKSQTQMTEKSQAGIKSSEIIRYRQHLADLRADEKRLSTSVEEQEKIVERAAQVIEKALAALNEASKETKVIEKHKENWQTQQKTKAGRREQRLNDEIAALLHGRTSE